MLAVLVAAAYLYGIAAAIAFGGVVLHAFAPETFNRIKESLS